MRLQAQTAPTNAKFNHYYDLHCKHLKLKGLQPKTIDAYSRGLRRIGKHFDGEVDDLSQEQMKYFTHNIDQQKTTVYQTPKEIYAKEARNKSGRSSGVIH